VRAHPFRKDRIEVQVELPMKGGGKGKQRQWFEPDHTEIKRIMRDGISDRFDERRLRNRLVGKRIKIPELEKEAQKQGLKLIGRK